MHLNIDSFHPVWGVKAVTFSGGGEPLVYPYITETMEKVLDAGIDLSIITNGSMLKGRNAQLFMMKNLQLAIRCGIPVHFCTRTFLLTINIYVNKHCWALPFMVYIDAKGNLWPCIVFMGKDELKYGNLYIRS